MRNLGKEELIEYLLNYAFKHGLSYILVKGEPYDPALSFKNAHKMVINTNQHNPNELPFIIGHEIGHLMLGDSGIAYWPSFSRQNSEEEEADLFSLKIIYDYSCKNGDYIQEPGTSMQSYGTPERMATATKQLFKDNDDLI